MRMRSLVGALSLVPLFALAGGGTNAYAEGSGAVAGGAKPFAAYNFAPLSCGAPSAPGHVHCMAKAIVDENGMMKPFAAGQGYGATDIQSAYSIPTSGSGGKIVAIVDAYDYPTAEQDLASYRSANGLPACTSASGCFTRVAGDGSTNYPGTDGAGCMGWNGEEALDLDMVSAACPDCKILLVEATDTSNQSLAAALATAAAKGAVAISNSYGGPEDNTVTSTESAYTLYNQGILVTASAGDSGYGASYPATSAGVLAIGGTSLTQGGGTRGWSETAWSMGGSGCSAYIAKPAWQTQTMCSERMEADISAVGDPQTGVAVTCGGQSFVVGGTSASSPIVAAMFTMLGVSPQPSWVWTHTSAFYDVTSGSNGSCTTSAQCNAGPGYDGPTGWGTPNGTALKTMTGSSSSGSGSGSGSGSSSGSSSSSSGSSSGSSGGGSGSGGSSGGSSGSSSSGGGSSNGSSGGNSSGSSAPPTTPDAGTGNNANGNNGGNTDVGSNLTAPASGCACTVTGTGESAGGLALGLGIVLGLAARRRRTR